MVFRYQEDMKNWVTCYTDNYAAPHVRAFHTMMGRGVLMDGSRRYPKIPGIMLEKLSVESRKALVDLRPADINDIRDEDIKLWVDVSEKEHEEKLKSAFSARMKRGLGLDK